MFCSCHTISAVRNDIRGICIKYKDFRTLLISDRRVSEYFCDQKFEVSENTILDENLLKGRFSNQKQLVGRWLLSNSDSISRFH